MPGPLSTGGELTENPASGGSSSDPIRTYARAESASATALTPVGRNLPSLTWWRGGREARSVGTAAAAHDYLERDPVGDNSSAASQVPPELNTGVPQTARIWNYWLGGKDNFPVDRQVGDQS